MTKILKEHHRHWHFPHHFHKSHYLFISLLKTEAILVSGDNECFTVTASSVVPNDALKSNQEEADTKVILHAIHIVIRSPSGDTDIMILALAVIAHQEKVYMDHGNGKRRKGT